MVNAVLPEEQQEAALDVLRRERLKLISLTPVRSSLEEYYIQKLRPAETRRSCAAEAQAGKNRKRRKRSGCDSNSSIGYIAFNTFREAVRDRVLYNLIAFALLLSGAAILVGEISIDIERLVVVNLGLTAVSLFGVVIAIFIGIGLVSKEIDKTHAVHRAFAAGAPLGVRRRQVLRPHGNAGGEYVLHGARRFSGAALRRPQI